MRIFPYKELYIRTSLTKVEAHTVILGYSAVKSRLSVPYMSIYDEGLYCPGHYNVKVVGARFEGYVEEVREQTALYGRVELTPLAKAFFLLPSAFTLFILRLLPLPWYIAAGSTLAVMGVSYLWVRFIIKEYSPYFAKRLAEILEKAETDKKERGTIIYENLSL